MPTTIKLKNSVTTTNAPSSLAQGEVAINITDKKVWVGNAATTPIQLLGAGSSASFGALSCTSLTNSGLTSGRVTYATTAGLLTDSANLTFNGTTLTVTDFTDSSLTAGRVVFPTTGGNLSGSANLFWDNTNGFLGIGTTSPSGRLHVATTGSAVSAFITSDISTSALASRLLLGNSAGTARLTVGLFGGGGEVGYFGSEGLFPIYFQTNGSERMRIDTSGNVGIGTSSPSSFNAAADNLVVGTTSGNNGITIAGGTSGFSSIYMADGTTGNEAYRGYIEYRHADDAMAFGTSASERMRIDSSGNVGIGTSSPVTKLELAGTTSSTALKITVTTATTYSQYTNNGGDFYVGRERSDGGGFGAPAYSSVLYSTGAYPMSFWTNALERMRITSGGDLLVGTTTSQGEKATFQSATISSANIGIVQIRSTKTSDSGDCALAIVKNANDSTTAQVFVRFGINGYASGSGQINANGASAAAFGSFSDIRLKENITDLPSQLANITALRPVEFDYKDGSGHQIGFIAQEMQKVYPDVVGESSDGMLMVTGWSKTEARLVKAIQEQQAMIEELKQEVAKLKGV